LRKPPHTAFKSKHQSKYKFRIATPSSALQASALKDEAWRASSLIMDGYWHFVINGLLAKQQMKLLLSNEFWSELIDKLQNLLWYVQK